MIGVFQILFYAQLLASLTYSLGALMYALPIPVYGIKKWGPRLITDSIYVVVWLSIYLFVLSFLQQLLYMLGASWGNYFTWLTEVQNYDILNYEIVAGVLDSLEVTSQLFAPLTVFSFLLSISISFIEFLLMISEMIYQYTGIFIALGILLMSIPFRIGRGIGASFIASAMVFYVGLPYLPNFLTQLDLNLLNLIQQPANPNLVVVLQYEIPQLFLANLIVPSSYLMLLSGLSIGLANTIGGYGGRVPFMVEIP